MDGKFYLANFVEPTIAEFEADPTSVRRAFLACVVTFHTRDYLKLSRQKLRGNPDFLLVDAVANAFKHVTESSPMRLSVSDVISRPAAKWNEAVWDLSRWDDEVGGVTIQSNRLADVLDAVKRTFKILKEQAERQVSL